MDLIRMIKLVKCECNSQVISLQEEIDRGRSEMQTIALATLELRDILHKSTKEVDREQAILSDAVLATCMPLIASSVQRIYNEKRKEVEDAYLHRAHMMEERILSKIDNIIANAMQSLSTRLINIEEELETDKLYNIKAVEMRDEIERVREKKITCELEKHLDLLSLANNGVQATNGELFYISEIVAEKVPSLYIIGC